MLAATVPLRVVDGMAVVATVATVARLSVDLEPDLDACVLVLDGLGVEVPATVVAGRAGPEGGRAVVAEVAVRDVESGVGLGANIALLLRGGRSEDAAAVLAVVDAWKAGQWVKQWKMSE